MKRDLPTTFSQMEVLSLLVDIKLDKEPRYRGNYLQIPKSYFGFNLVSKKLLHFCKKNEMKNLIGMGVDGIMTDRCRALLKVLKSSDFIDKKITLEPFLVA